MTVCVAAIGGWGSTLILAADRTLTGLMEYQSPEPKIFGLTRSIVAMWAGEDAGFQALIHAALLAEVNEAVKAAPTVWLEVGKTALRYQYHYNEVRRHRMAQHVLEPLGFPSIPAFMAAQKKMPPREVERIYHELRSYRAPAIAALIVGMDKCGKNPEAQSVAHIYSFVSDGGPSSIASQDHVGYAAIGIGEVHARFQLMRAGHGPSAPSDDTLLQTFLAKKRAERAPGVSEGETTDLFYFKQRPPDPGFIDEVGSDIVEALEAAYERLEEAELNASTDAAKAIGQMLAERPPAVPPVGQTTGPESPADTFLLPGVPKPVDELPGDSNVA